MGEVKQKVHPQWIALGVWVACVLNWAGFAIWGTSGEAMFAVVLVVAAALVFLLLERRD